jgi:hypothetical protein
MKRVFAVAMFCAASGMLAAQSPAGEKPAKQPNPVQLELTMEVATTTEDGLPAALRFTLTNIGNVAGDMPYPGIDCHGSNGGIFVRAKVRLDGPSNGGSGHSCAGGLIDGPSFSEMVKSSWVHLRPGESLTFTGDRRNMLDRVNGPATYDYWAEYESPPLTEKERAELAEEGRYAPSEKTVSAHLRFSQP